ncbi:MAG TPA: hypothetical protein VFT13_10920 [Candidatus Krumholzibacteria bacterium]|nr:hypothetical protein [Candidatus Krumholzibacteria bacterium]
MKQELVDRYPGDSLVVTIVWSPMMPGDSEDAAREASRMFDSTRVEQCYDPNRRVGDVLRRRVFSHAYDQALASLPADHWLRESMPQMKSRYEKSPEWDIYMFFEPGLEWNDAPPRPTRFVRHLGRVIEKNGERLSLMWIDGYDNPPVEGNLPTEIGRLGRELLEPVGSGR